MKNFTGCCTGIFSLLILIGPAFAQPGVVVKQRVVTFEGDVVISADEELANTTDPQSRAAFFFELPAETLLAAAEEQGVTPDQSDNTMYLAAGNFRIDMVGSEGEQTAIIRKAADTMTMIFWNLQKYAVVSLAEIRAMRQKAMQGMKNMPDMGDMQSILDKLPPEARAKALEAMKNAGQLPSQQSAPALQKTGRQTQKAGFEVEEYRQTEKNKSKNYWVTRSKPQIVALYGEVMELFGGAMGEKGEDDITTQLPGTMPVEERTFTTDMFRGEISLKIEAVTEFEEKTLPASTFDFDKAGLTEVSIMDLMMGQGMRKKKR